MLQWCHRTLCAWWMSGEAPWAAICRGLCNHLQVDYVIAVYAKYTVSDEARDGLAKHCIEVTSVSMVCSMVQRSIKSN